MAKSMDFPKTKLAYFDDMSQLQARATFISTFVEGDRIAVVLDSTILYPQGGGQPADNGYISDLDDQVKFRVEDVRSRDGVPGSDPPFKYWAFVLVSSFAAQTLGFLQAAICLVDPSLKMSSFVVLMQLQNGNVHSTPHKPILCSVLAIHDYTYCYELHLIRTNSVSFLWYLDEIESNEIA
eukprot:Gb_24716 [translate_table: standard]